MFNFDLVFRLPAGTDHETVIDALFEAGCDDATPGIGQDGYVALAFQRDGDTALEAMVIAIEEVERTIPGARLTEVGPHLVTIRELGSLFKVSWQAFQRHANNAAGTFPAPVRHENPRIWRLIDVVGWVEGGNARFAVPEGLADIAHATAKVSHTLDAPKDGPAPTGQTSRTLERIAAHA